MLLYDLPIEFVPIVNAVLGERDLDANDKCTC